MIIEKYKTIFIHIPKNAGTAIERFFNEDSRKHVIGAQVSGKHDTISMIKQKFPEEYDSYTKFTIIRNPYDRMVSWYFYLCEKAKQRPMYVPPPFYTWVRNPMSFFFDTERFLNPQNEWIDNTVKIVKYENLNKDLSKLFEKEIILPVVNKSNHSHYLDYYDKGAFAIVNEKYKEDFKKYNYRMITN